MAVDPSARQSDWISTFRSDLSVIVNGLATLDQDRLKAASLGGVDSFVPAAFAGSNADLQAGDIDAVLTALTTLRLYFFDSSNNPTAALLAITKVAK